MNFQDDLLTLMKKHGLDEADVKSDKSSDDGEVKEQTSKADEDADSKVAMDLADAIGKKITDAIAEAKGYNEDTKKDLNQHVDKELRTKVFTPWAGTKEISYPADLTKLSKEEKIVNFFKALVYHRADPNSHRVLRALVEGTESEGGYLVPEELRTEIFRVLPDMAVMRNLARVIPMSTDTLKLNSLSARPVAYWTSEYASSSTSSAGFGQVTLSPNDLVALLPVSEQLLADANVDLVQFIIELFTEAIAIAEDKAFFTGSGSGQPRGINQESLNSVAAGGALSFDHILSMLDKVPQRVTQSGRAAFVGNRTVKTHLRQLKDNNGNYIWRDGGTGPGAGNESTRLPDTIYGYPFWEQNDVSGDELYFGDWGMYIIGDRQAVSVRTTTEGGDAWRRNAMEIKAVERVDGRAVITSPFTKATGIQS